MPSFLRLILCLFLLSATAGCYNTPVRHLSSDVALIDVGTSSRSDVLVYLGEPDDQVIQGDGVERWLYNDTRKTFIEGAPVVGKYLGTPEEIQVIVTLQNNVVQDCTFTSADKDDLSWKDDFEWQKKETK